MAAFCAMGTICLRSSFGRRGCAWAFLAPWLLAAAGAGAQNARDAVVEVTAVGSATAPHVTLQWPLPSGDPLPGNPPKLWRRVKGAADWGTPIILGPNATSYADAAALPGVAYEYSLQDWRVSTTVLRYGAIVAGHHLPLVEQRGKVLLYVDETMAAPLAAELEQFRRDLVADGWKVYRQDGPRGVVLNGSTKTTDHAPRRAEREAMRAAIRSFYDANPGGDWALVIIGRAPVAYSGNVWPDGHTPDHAGAWPTDAYYADVDGVWGDESVNTTVAADPRNRNVPGDGKFDPSILPSEVEIKVGRIDFAGMTATPSGMTEVELLRQYLVRNHRFRRGLAPYDAVARRGLVTDAFTSGSHAAQAYASSGWRAAIGFFGREPGQVDALAWFPTLETTPMLFAYGSGAGTYTSMAGVGTSTSLAGRDSKAVFTMLFGSYFGDWDTSNGFLRVPLAGTPDSLGLASVWSGRGYVHLQHMALGEEIGYGIRFTQNNRADVSSGGWNQNSYLGSPTYNLMGDPTLRLHTVRPPSGLTASALPEGVTLAWTPSPDAAAGYHVYRAASPDGPFVRLTGGAATGVNPAGSPLAATGFTDAAAAAGADYTYLVKAVRIEATASGSYANQSLGEAVTVSVGTPFELWCNGHGIAAAPAADADQDGLPNLAEYALGGEPLVPDAPAIAPRAALFETGGAAYLALDVSRDPAAAGIACQVEVSDDLVHWHSGPPHTTVIEDAPGRLRVRDNTPQGTAPRRFIRLRLLEEEN